MTRNKFAGTVLMLGFLLGVSNGYIALWRDGVSTPVQVFPYRIETLPAADQQALRRGVSTSDRMELAELLEDYLS